MRAYTQLERLRVSIRNLLCVPVGVAVAVASTGAIAGAPNPPDDEVVQAIEADPSPAEGTNHNAMSGAMPKTTVKATVAGICRLREGRARVGTEKKRGQRGQKHGETSGTRLERCHRGGLPGRS